MKYLSETVDTLRRHDIDHALIGAMALAAHGLPRSTGDLDLLVLDRLALHSRIWGELEARGAGIDIRFGDEVDPLAGVIRIGVDTPEPIDLIVGRSRWQHPILERAADHRVEIAGCSLPVVSVADLVLLKLYAGGPVDRRDIEDLLGAFGRELVDTVDQRVEALPRRARTLWEQLRVGQ